MICLAEGEGFEPSMGCPIPVFKTGALVHSAIPPEGKLSLKANACAKLILPYLPSSDKERDSLVQGFREVESPGLHDLNQNVMAARTRRHRIVIRVDMRPTLRLSLPRIR